MTSDWRLSSCFKTTTPSMPWQLAAVNSVLCMETLQQQGSHGLETECSLKGAVWDWLVGVPWVSINFVYLGTEPYIRVLAWMTCSTWHSHTTLCGAVPKWTVNGLQCSPATTIAPFILVIIGVLWGRKLPDHTLMAYDKDRLATESRGQPLWGSPLILDHSLFFYCIILEFSRKYSIKLLK